MPRPWKRTLAILAAILLMLLLLPEEPYRLRELVSGVDEPAGFRIEWPLARFFLEPLYGFGQYLIGLDRFFSYQRRLLVVMLWFAIPAAAITYLLRRSILVAVSAALFAVTLVFSAILITLLAPYPGPRLIAPENYIVFDNHSHSYHSHDSVRGPALSSFVHKSAGYDSFFITEHSHTRSVEHFDPATTLPGVQMITTFHGVSLLILSDRKFDGDAYRGLGIAELIRKAHAEDALVVVPHWWKWRRPPLSELLDMGIDGFEVFNSAYKYLSGTEQRDLIDFCLRNGLLMLGGTDWHGWGNIQDVWNALEIRGDGGKQSWFELLRQRAQPKILVYTREENRSRLRLAFEPFFATYYYLTSLDAERRFCLFLWICAGAALLGRRCEILRRRFLLLMGLLFAFGAVYYFGIFLEVRRENEVILTALLPGLVALSAGWLAYYFFPLPKGK